MSYFIFGSFDLCENQNSLQEVKSYGEKKVFIFGMMRKSLFIRI